MKEIYGQEKAEGRRFVWIICNMHPQYIKREMWMNYERMSNIMKKKILAALLATCMTFSLAACGGSSDNSTTDTSDATTTETEEEGSEPVADAETETATETAGEPIKDLVIASVVGNEIDHMIMQHSEGSNVAQVGGNCLSPLLEFNNYGALVPAVASEWGTEDEGHTWTFKLRDDVTYVDVNGEYLGDCTAQDWVTSLEWVLNFHKNGGLCTSMPTSTIAGAKEYYEYTKGLSEADGLAIKATDATFLDMVGIEAVDDYTLVYTCIDKCAYFDTLATSSCLYPMPQGMIDAVGVEGVIGISNEDFWYSGPYRMTTWVPNNEKVFTKNESYWDKDCTLFDTVTMAMVEDALTDDTLWTSGEVDVCALDTSTLSTIYSDHNNADYDNLVETRISKYSGSMLFNYDKRFEDGTPDTNWNTAIGNEAFRQAMYWGLDWSNYWYLTNAINPMNLENLAYTSPSLGVFSDGTDYTTRVIELLDIPEKTDDKTPRRYQPETAEEYKQQAIEELTAEGVTFPVTLDYYIKAGNQTELDKATVLKEAFDALGSDFINFNILTYVSSYAEEVMFPQLMSMATVAWGADFGDVSNFVDQCLIDDDAAIYSVERLCLAEVTNQKVIDQFTEFTELARKAGAITGDKDARLEAYAQAEAYLVGHAMVIPCYITNNWQLTKVNDYSKMYAAYGISDTIFKNWETSTVPYTTEDYARFKEEYEAGANK